MMSYIGHSSRAVLLDETRVDLISATRVSINHLTICQLNPPLNQFARMSLTRSTRVLNRSFLRPLAAPSLQIRSFVASGRRLGDYGSGEGDPKGEKPKEQGANPSADKEHPGPPPPKAGLGTGGGPTKGTAEGHNTSESKQEGGKRSYSTLSRRYSGSCVPSYAPFCSILIFRRVNKTVLDVKGVTKGRQAENSGGKAT